MYSTCLFCNRSLGANEAIEHFPVGRRVAFDAAKGRLWAVCATCSQWNLTPLDERWEAIEECERLFDATRLQVSTPNVGLARVADGTELIRVGAPQRPELAAWRYGDRFGRRKRRSLQIGVPLAVVSAGMLLVPGAGFIAGVVAGSALVGSLASFTGSLLHGVHMTSLAASDGEEIALRGKDINAARLRAVDGRWTLQLRRGKSALTYEGDDVRRVLGALLPVLNWAGGSASQVSTAVDAIERVGSAEAYFAATASDPKAHGITPFGGYTLASLPRPVRLAFEMAAHEETERRALEGELTELEEAWRRAEEIAAIADDMFLPPVVRGAFARLKG